MATKTLTRSSSSSTACIMGHIIATAAVFEIHIETNIVTAVNPKFNLNVKRTRKKSLNSRFSRELN